MKTEDWFKVIYTILFAVIIGAFIVAAWMRERREAEREADFIHAARVILEGGVR